MASNSHQRSPLLFLQYSLSLIKTDLRYCDFESRLWQGALDTTLCDKVCHWLVTGRWFFSGTLGSSTNKTEHHDIAEISLKVTLNTITSSSSCRARFQMHWDSKVLLNYPLNRGYSLERPLFHLQKGWPYMIAIYCTRKQWI